MMRRKLHLLAVVGLAAAIFVGAPRAEAAVPTDFTYQGQLLQGGEPFNGQANFDFRLFAQAAGGTMLQEVSITNVPVTDGRLTVDLAFNPIHFTGDERWLEIRVNGFTLSPRQPLLPAPYSIFALNAHGPSITGINASNITSGTLSDARLSSNVVRANIANTFTGGNTFQQALSLGAQGTTTSHAVRADRTISTSGGLTGGGNLTANRTLSIADNGVTGAKIADLAISDSKISSVGWSKVTGAPSFLTFESDPSWNGAAISTGAISRTGNVGIGVASPAAAVDASGTSTRVIRAVNTTTTGIADGVEARAASPVGYAVYGVNSAATGSAIAGRFHTDSPTGYAGYFTGGRNYFGGDVGIGVTSPTFPLHVTSPTTNTGATIYANHPRENSDAPAVEGHNTNSSWYGIGVRGTGAYIGVRAIGSASDSGTQTASRYGLWASASVADVTNYGVYSSVGGGTPRYGVYATAAAATDSWAGYFVGNTRVTGTLSKGGGSFMIDHPLEPETKYLYHSFVESPDMMNIYNGNIITDEQGFATITMPDWFEALNRDFRYQLTVIDEGDDLNFVLVKVVRRIQDGQFAIRTSQPNVEVSWQVTGVRQDAFAETHRIPVEVDKAPEDHGLYLHPEAFGQPPERGIEWRRSPEGIEQQRALLNNH